MNEEKSENDLSGWCSTYGLITAQRILEGYKIKLQSDDLVHTLKSPDTFYNRLLRIPLRNVFNGIILQQARDYQLYAQKLFIDYLLSGEGSKPEESPGAATREDLEEARKSLLLMTENFHECELAHELLIAQSQVKLMKDAAEWQKVLISIAKEIKNGLAAFAIMKSDNVIMQSLIILLTSYDFKSHFNNKKTSWDSVEKILEIRLNNEIQQVFLDEISKLSNLFSATDASLTDFGLQIKQMSLQLRQFRTDFYNFIIRANELIKLLPDYTINSQQNLENREALFFDSTLGGLAESK